MNSIQKLIGEAEDFSEYEDLLALDAEQEKTLFDRYPKLSPEEAYYEAKRLGKGNVPEELEKVVAKHSHWAYVYALYVLKSPFPLGEEAIFRDAYSRINYKAHFGLK